MSLVLTQQDLTCRRLQQDNASVGAVGTACTLGPTCNSLNVSCKITATTAITDAGTSLSGLNVIQSGCLLVPDAGSNVSLPSTLADLNMDSLFQLLVVTEDTLYPTPNRKDCASALSQAACHSCSNSSTYVCSCCCQAVMSWHSHEYGRPASQFCTELDWV